MQYTHTSGIPFPGNTAPYHREEPWNTSHLYQNCSLLGETHTDLSEFLPKLVHSLPPFHVFFFLQTVLFMQVVRGEKTNKVCEELFPWGYIYKSPLKPLVFS